MESSLENLSSPELIAQFVLECRGTGTVLPYDDYSIIQEWMAILPNTEHLLLILADVLPTYFAGKAGKTPRGLKGARRRILQKISTVQKR